MAVRTIYVNPKDLVQIKVIRNAELPKNNKEFEYQIRPQNHQIKIAENGDAVIPKGASPADIYFE